MAGQQYASGNWTVKAGSEDEFVARWIEFLSESTKTAEGFRTARLLRDSDDPRHFLSFSEWADAGARDAMEVESRVREGAGRLQGALRRLRRRGLLAGRERLTSNAPTPHVSVP
jgi:heme-degrading monooxygenase HmoA